MAPSEKTVNPDPFLQFERWYEERISDEIPVPNTVSLGTSSEKGEVSLRTVLLKGYDEKGFVFFTNYKSRKGKQMKLNAFAALLFYWPESGRQIRIEGVVSKTTAKESDSYFSTRPEESRISAWASEQSSNIPDRQYLEERFQFFRKKFKGKSIPRPPHWGGYRLIPHWFEFWQDGKHRLHDRITYSISGDKWLINRLAP